MASTRRRAATGRGARAAIARRLAGAADAAPGLLALAAALRRNGPTVIDALVDPAGYPRL